MNARNEIERTLKQEGSIRVIQELLAQTEHKSRNSVAESVCRHFGFLDARQRTQVSGCAKALSKLERAGHFALPTLPHKARAVLGSPWRLPSTCRRKPVTFAG
jgi:hypothetical protein